MFVICNSYSFNSFINDCSHIEYMYLFCAHLIYIFSLLRGVELRHVRHSFHPKCRPSATLSGYLICVICTSRSFHSFIFNLCIMIVRTLNMSTSLSCTFHEYLLFLGVLYLDIFPSKILRWCLVYVICNSISFNSFIFKLCITIVHILKKCTSYFVNI